MIQDLVSVANTLKTQIDDLAHVSNGPEIIQLNGFTLGKDIVMKTLRTEIRASHAKLGELLKKL